MKFKNNRLKETALKGRNTQHRATPYAKGMKTQQSPERAQYLSTGQRPMKKVSSTTKP